MATDRIEEITERIKQIRYSHQRDSLHGIANDDVKVLLAALEERERINKEIMNNWQLLADAVNRYRIAIQPIVDLDRAFKGGHVDSFHIEQQIIDNIVTSYNDLISLYRQEGK